MSPYSCKNRTTVLKKVLKLSSYRSRIFLVKYQYLQSLQQCEDQGVCGKLEKPVHKHMLAIVATDMETSRL